MPSLTGSVEVMKAIGMVCVAEMAAKAAAGPNAAITATSSAASSGIWRLRAPLCPLSQGKLSRQAVKARQAVKSSCQGKQFELLRELLPKSTVIGLLVKPPQPAAGAAGDVGSWSANAIEQQRKAPVW